MKSSPTNADLRERTLQRGRVYSDRTRGQQGVTLFDEVALLNDINAACGGAVPAAQPASQSAQSVEQRLEKLRALKEKGLISEEEYQTQRTKIVGEI